MDWNYRVVRTDFTPFSGVTDHTFAISEVYYEGDEVMAWGDAAPVGNNLTDLRSTLMLMLWALDKPVLLAIDLPGYGQ